MAIRLGASQECPSCWHGSVTFTQEPVRRTISYCGDKYFLSFPEMIFELKYCREESHFRFIRLYAGFSVNSDSAHAVHPFLNNVGSDLYVCMGVRSYGHSHSVEELGNLSIAHFWNSEFTEDIDDRNSDESLDTFSYFRWAAKTSENSSWVPRYFGDSEIVEFLKCYCPCKEFVG